MASWLGHCLLLLFCCLCCGHRNERKCASPNSPMTCRDGKQTHIAAACYDLHGYCKKEVCESEELFMNDSTVCGDKEPYKCYPSFNSTQIRDVYRKCPSNKPCNTWQLDTSSSAGKLCLIYICADGEKSSVKDTKDPCQEEKQQSMKGLSIAPSSSTGTCQRVCTISPDAVSRNLHMESNFVDESDVNDVAYRVVENVNTNTARWITMDRFYRRYDKVSSQQGNLEIRFCFADVANVLGLWILFGDRVSIRCRDAAKNVVCQPAVSESTQPAVSESTKPAVSESTQPAVSESTQPAVSEHTTRTTATAVSESTQPDVSESTQPAVSESTQPAVSESTQPDVSEHTTSTIATAVPESTQPDVSESTQPDVSEHTTSTIATAVPEENKTRVLTAAVASAVVVTLAFGIVLLVFFYKRHKKLRREAHTTHTNSPETPSLSTDGSNLPAVPRHEKTQNDYEEVGPEKSDVRVDESPAGGRVSQRRYSDYEEAEDASIRPDTGERNIALGDDCAAHSAIAGYASCSPASASSDDGLYRQLKWRQGEERQRETEIVYNHTVNPQVTGDNPDNSCSQTTQSADDLYDLLSRQRREVVIDNVYNTTKP